MSEELREFDLNIINAGLDPYTRSEKEKQFFPEVDEESEFVYLSLRNLFVNTWQKNPLVAVEKETVEKELLAKRYPALRDKVHTYLNTFAHINHGVFSRTTTLSPKPQRVCVVGGGVAGLAVLSRLLKNGYRDAKLLEARDRLGGRVHAVPLAKTETPIDLGASIVSGLVGNPLHTLLHQQNLLQELYQIDAHVSILSAVDKNKKLSATKDKRVTDLWNRLLADAKTVAEQSGESASLADFLRAALVEEKLDADETAFLLWLAANLEYANCTALVNVSGRHWDQDDPFDFVGKHSYVKSSYWALLAGLASTPHTVTGAVVSRIVYGDAGCRVFYSVGETVHEEEFDAVFVTIPLAVLQANSLLFEPALPPAKQLAVARLGAGVMNKVVLEFESVFWNNERADGFAVLDPGQFVDTDYFGLLKRELQEDSLQRGLLHIFWNFHNVLGEPVLLALCSGDAALAVENMSEAALGELAFEKLRSVFPGATKPCRVTRTQWGKDPFSRMSYSFVGKEASGADYDALQEPVGDRLFFAGEACSQKHPATVVGGYLSGLTAVSQFLLAHCNETRLALESRADVGIDLAADEQRAFLEDKQSFQNSKNSAFLAMGIFGKTLGQSHKKRTEVRCALEADKLIEAVWDDEKGLLAEDDEHCETTTESGEASFLPDFRLRKETAKPKRRPKREDLKHFVDKKRLEQQNKQNFKTLFRKVYKLVSAKVAHKEVVKKVTMRVAEKYFAKFKRDRKKFKDKYGRDLVCDKFLNEKLLGFLKKDIRKTLNRYKKPAK